MKLAKSQLKQIILEEAKKHLEEVGLARVLKTAGTMSLDVFNKTIKAIKSITKNLDEKNYLEIAGDIIKVWRSQGVDGVLRYWSEIITLDDKELFLKMTYPTWSMNKAEKLVVDALLRGNFLSKILLSDVRSAAERMAKEINVGAGQSRPEYLGPMGPRGEGEPKSPYWKEFLEEVVEAEVVNGLLEAASYPVGMEKEPEVQKNYPYWILLNDDVPVLFPEGYEEEAINTYNIMMDKEGVKEISPALSDLIAQPNQLPEEGNE